MLYKFLKISILVILCFIIFKSAAYGRVSMKVEPGFESCYKEQCWMPIEVVLKNDESLMEGALRLELTEPKRQTLYLKPVSLAAHSHKKYTLYVLMTRYTARVKVILALSQKKPIVEEITVRPVPAEDTMVLVLSRSKSGLNFLAATKLTKAKAPPPGPPFYFPSGPGMPMPMPPSAGMPGKYGPPMMGLGRAGPSVSKITGEVRVTHLDTDDLPDKWAGYEGIDIIVLGDVDLLNFSDEQIRAIKGWLITGGNLIVSGGADVVRVRNSWVEPLLPVELVGTRTVYSLDSLGRRYGQPVESEGYFQICDSRLRTGQTIVSEKGIPIIVKGKVGLGKVIFMAFDLQGPPVVNWAGSLGMWRQILEGLMKDEPFKMSLDRNSQIVDAVMRIPAMNIPSFKFVGLFLLLYIILLVPVNYLILKKLGKREYSWIITPIIVFLFTIGAYVTGYTIKGGRSILNKISVIKACQNMSLARSENIVGLFSAKKTAYDIGLVSPDALARGEAFSSQYGRDPRYKSEVKIVETETHEFKDIRMDMWSMKAFGVDSLVDLGNGIQADLKYSQNVLKGTMFNATPYDLEDCYLIFKNGVQEIGKFSRGAKKAVKLSIPKPAKATPPGKVGVRGPYRGGPMAMGMPGSPINTILQSPGFRDDTPEGAIKSQMVQFLRATGEKPVFIGFGKAELVKMKLNRGGVREKNLSGFIVELAVR